MLDCLFKYSDMQITYGINMMAIADGQPKLLGLLSLLDYYTPISAASSPTGSTSDIEQAQEKEHKLAGLIIAVTNIDRVIQIIVHRPTPKRGQNAAWEELSITRRSGPGDFGSAPGPADPAGSGYPCKRNMPKWWPCWLSSMKFSPRPASWMV